MIKRCTACGVDKPIEQFRPYYNRPNGHYPFCKECERIETKRKYLVKLGDRRSEEQTADLNKIEKLYDIRQAAGLKVPSRIHGARSAKPSVSSIVDEQLKKLSQ